MPVPQRSPSPSLQLAVFIRRFDPPVQRLIRATRAALRKEYPTANQLVYDGYNALAIGFCSGLNASSCLVSVAAYARGVNLYFYHGARLPDPEKRLEGSGNQGRFVRVTTTAVLQEAAVRRLLRAAAKDISPPLPRSGRGKLVIRSAQSKRRSRSSR